MGMSDIEIVEADLNRPDHQEAVVALIDAYSRDPMGDDKPLPDGVRDALVPGLRQHPTTLVFLAYCDGTAIGIAVCFFGFSTFAARPLVNVHDLAVVPESRGQGAARRLLDAVEQKARQTGCCKITLEVLEHNHRARQVYQAFGFGSAEYAGTPRGSLFLTKKLY